MRLQRFQNLHGRLRFSSLMLALASSNLPSPRDVAHLEGLSAQGGHPNVWTAIAIDVARNWWRQQTSEFVKENPITDGFRALRQDMLRQTWKLPAHIRQTGKGLAKSL